ncbi:uncharacterized protein LOC141633388 isoform X2 [Silene latifolia]|uniref:uncharacterized protein LOC141633388 isoform X2 n=1 Tax=Silene latifolia TaxID=37657 RepID=UPI003D776F5D
MFLIVGGFSSAFSSFLNCWWISPRLLTPPETSLFPSLDDKPASVDFVHNGRARSRPISLSRSSTRITFAAAEVVASSTAWLGLGLSCVCMQRRDSGSRPSFDLSPTQKRLAQGGVRFAALLEEIFGAKTRKLYAESGASYICDLID